jgi:hypothetical protein
MMHRLVSTLMSLFLALHTVLGCCWHHAHACTDECDKACAVESPAAHVDWHGSGWNTGSGDQHHHGQHECQGMRCVFVNMGSRTAPSLSLQPHLAAACCLPHRKLPIHVVAGGPYFSPDELLPPLRLHLAHQVLLL